MCRICLQDGDLISIFEKLLDNDNSISYAEKILQVFNSINLVSISCCITVAVSLCHKNAFRNSQKKEENLPQQICSSCVNDLEAAYRFKMNCESTEAILQTYIPIAEQSEEIHEELDEQDPVEFYAYRTSEIIDTEIVVPGGSDHLDKELDVSLALCVGAELTNKLKISRMCW